MTAESRKPAPCPVRLHWLQSGRITEVPAGTDWLTAARQAGETIPTGCLQGSCGACDIDVDDEVVRACIAAVPITDSGKTLAVGLCSDP